MSYGRLRDRVIRAVPSQFHRRSHQTERMSRQRKLGSVGASGQEEPNLLAVLRVVIIMFDAFANFRGGDPNNGVSVGIVVGWPAEDFDTKNTLLELVGLTR